MVEQLSFTYKGDTPKLVCGRDCMHLLREEVDALAAKRAMIICGPGVLNHSDVVSRVQSALGERYVGIFSGVQPHVPLETIHPAIEIAKEVKADLIISIGGGSTHDTARSVVILLAEGGDLRDYGLRGDTSASKAAPQATRPKIPIVAVPTTFGTAEFGGSGGFSDRAAGRFVQISDPLAAPKANIIDGLALATTPVPVLLSTGIGQIRIAIENIYSKEHNPIIDALSLHSLKLLKKLLPLCVERDPDTLLQAKIAAGLPAIKIIKKGLNTALGHQIGSLFDIDHGIANAIPLPHTMRFNADASAERQALIAEAFGTDISKMTSREAALSAADQVAELVKSLGLPTRLRDIGIPESALETIAKAAMNDKHIPANPRAIPNYQSIMGVLRESW